MWQELLFALISFRDAFLIGREWIMNQRNGIMVQKCIGCKQKLFALHKFAILLYH